MTHLSAFALDALALDALDATAAADAREHLAVCARCRGDHEAAAAFRDHFAAHVLARARPPRRRRASWAWLTVPALAGAIGLAVVVTRPHGAPERAPDLAPELAIKGDAAWQVFADRDGQIFAVHDGTQLEPGDRIRFAVTPDGAHYLLVASIDGAGAVSIYFPYGGTESAPLDPGERVELPGSIVLDAAPGPERLFALFSDEPVGTAAVADQLRAIGADGPDAIRQAHLLAVDGARAQVSLVFEKSVP